MIVFVSLFVSFASGCTLPDEIINTISSFSSRLDSILIQAAVLNCKQSHIDLTNEESHQYVKDSNARNKFDFCVSDPLTDITLHPALVNANRIVISDPGSLPVLPRLTGLKALTIHGPLIHDLSVLESMTQLQALGCFNTPALRDIGPLRFLRNLTTLSFYSPSGINDLSPLAELTSLVSLHIFIQVQDFSPLSGLVNVRVLIIENPVNDLSFLHNLQGLVSLQLSLGPDIRSLQGLEHLTNLHNLKIRGATHLADISALAFLGNSLETFHCHDCLSLTNIGPLACLPNLRQVDFAGSPVANVTPLGKCEKLEELGLGPELVNLEALEGHPNIYVLEVFSQRGDIYALQDE